MGDNPRAFALPPIVQYVFSAATDNKLRVGLCRRCCNDSSVLFLLSTWKRCRLHSNQQARKCLLPATVGNYFDSQSWPRSARREARVRETSQCRSKNSAAITGRANTRAQSASKAGAGGEDGHAHFCDRGMHTLYTLLFLGLQATCSEITYEAAREYMRCCGTHVQMPLIGGGGAAECTIPIAIQAEEQHRSEDRRMATCYILGCRRPQCGIYGGSPPLCLLCRF